MFRILKKSVKTGVVTGEYPEAATPEPEISDEAREKAKPFQIGRAHV